jgi:hypothetical protein
MAKNVTIIPASGSLTFDNVSTFGEISLDGSNNLVISGSTIVLSSPVLLVLTAPQDGVVQTVLQVPQHLPQV